MFNENMEDKQNGSKKNLPVVRQAFHGKKDYHKLLQPAMLQKRLQTPDEGAQNGTQGNSGNA
ncbi:hypothetical protein KML24003_16090 [Alistipes finegoldii]|jgi:hypothetical protein